jgi:undecaprenyl-diphosphatase
MKLRYLILIIILLIISNLFDKKIILFLVGNRTLILNYFFVYFTKIFTSAVILILILALFIKKRRYLLSLVFSYFITGFLCYLMKNIVMRTRPFIALGLEKLIGVSYNLPAWNTSFPSWHTAAVFTAVPFLYKTKHKLRHVWLVFSLVVSFNRIYVGLHYLSDVLVGVLLGYLIGYLFLYLEDRYSFGKKLLNKF